jgi:pimeloyl-ACP methyl ester carboxylesterase
LIGIVVLVVFVILVYWLGFRPIHTADLVSRPKPANSYDEALRRLEELHTEEENLGGVQGVCLTRMLSHGDRTPVAIVFLHGYTSCPEQFQMLAEQVFKLGYNVLLPRMPYHGMADRLTDELRKLTAEDMARYGDTAVDIARGLGDKVAVMGISGGGTVAAWLAQNRSDVDYAMPLAPFLGMAFIPAALTRPFARLMLSLPNIYSWWDPRTKENNPYSIYYAYPRFSFRALAETLRLGLAVLDQAQQKAAAAGRIVLITNLAEPGVSNPQCERLLAEWRKQGKKEIRTYQFDKEMKMPHDIITPGTPGVPVDIVYERLIQLINEETGLKQA